MNGFNTYQRANGDIQSAALAVDQQSQAEIHFKAEPSYTASIMAFSSESQANAHGPYAYNTNSSFSEQELAESLGWNGYATAAHLPMSPSSQRLHMTSEMTMHNTSPLNHSNPSSYQQSGGVSNMSFGSMAIPQVTSGSPVGWHSSMESPSLLGDLPRSLGLTPCTNVSTTRKDGSSVAEKKAMRRYSHNAVERRRRDNINEQIQELAALVPTTILGPSLVAHSPRADGAVAVNPAVANAKPNKGIVLRKSVEYIQLLKNIVEEKTERERQMENEIRRLGGYVPPVKRSPSSSNTWADDFATLEDED